MTNIKQAETKDEIIHSQTEEIIKLELAIRSIQGEIIHALNSNKSMEVREYYMQNALRRSREVVFIT